MKRKSLLILISCMLLGCFGATVTAHELGHAKIDKSEWKSLLEQGYKKKDLVYAKEIAHFAKKEMKDVLTYYEKSKSWEKTATHFGVELEVVKDKMKEMKRKRDERKQFYEEYEEEIFQYLAEYTETSEEELRAYQESREKFRLHKLMKAAVIAKLSNQTIGDVWKEYEKGTPWKEIAKRNSLDQETIWKELRKVKEEIKKRKHT